MIQTLGVREAADRGSGGGGSANRRRADPARMAYGGKTVYGARVGILMLETHFPRVPGDIGNAMTWPFPVLYKVVRGATPRHVHTREEGSVLDDFVAAGKELVRDGADGLTTSCGFLSLYQDRLTQECGVPVAASALMQIPFVESLLPPGQRAGVLTANSETLTHEHLEAAGARGDTPMVGAQELDGAWPPSAIPRENSKWDMAAAERDMLLAGERLRRNHAEVGAIVLECTNMPPFSRALRDHLGLPVYDIYTLIRWFHAGLAPRDFGHPGSAPRAWREGRAGKPV